MDKVTRVELKDDKYNKYRLAAVILLLAVGAFALASAFTQFLNGSSGWTEIEANAAAEINCAGDFVFLYELGAGGQTPSAESKAVRAVYTDACVKLYQLFNVYQEFEGVHNLCYINAHPGEEIVVDPVLYDAFSLAEACGERRIYLAPVYEVCDNIFYCGDDSETAVFDPEQNEELAEFCGQTAEFASDGESIEIELLGDNTIRLSIAPEYKSWLDAESVTQYVDFYWMKNAFIADALAEELAAQGYTRGVISSHDGFVRNLDTRDVTYAFNLYDRFGDTVYDAGTMEYAGALSLVSLRNYPLNQIDRMYYYEFADGTLRTAYRDIADGSEKCARNNLVTYSRGMGCGELLMHTAPVFVADEWDGEAPGRLLQSGIHCIYGGEMTLYYNDSDISITGLYDKGDVSYRAVLQ
ncbi:MAG: hypothetical protein NC355_08900 [Blautia sp.]|nr:hypothetical protein [Blautia sp.]